MVNMQRDRKKFSGTVICPEYSNVSQSFRQECLRGGGPKGVDGLGVQKGWGAGGPPLGEKKSDFKILVLEMSYFNCNNRQILKIHLCTFICFANKGEGNIPPQLLSGGARIPPPPPPLSETLFLRARRALHGLSSLLIKEIPILKIHETL